MLLDRSAMFCFVVISGQLVLVLAFNTLRIINVSKKCFVFFLSKDISVTLPDDYFSHSGATEGMPAMNLSVQPFSVVLHLGKASAHLNWHSLHNEPLKALIKYIITFWCNI